MIKKILLPAAILACLLSCNNNTPPDIPPTDITPVPVTSTTANGVPFVATFAGNGVPGLVHSTPQEFNGVCGVAIDAAGNMYVADRNNHMIRKFTVPGVEFVVAGSGNPGYADGLGASAQFSSPTGVAVDAVGNVYVADAGNHRIRKITAAGVVSTLAGSGTPGLVNGTGTLASFNSPMALTIDAAGNVYVADQGNHVIRMITSAGAVSTLAGTGTPAFLDGPAASAQFSSPSGVVMNMAGILYVADRDNHRIRKIVNGIVTTLAGNGVAGFGDGPPNFTQFNAPYGVALDLAGNIFVADKLNQRIRKITPGGLTSTIAGSGAAGFANGSGDVAKFNSPTSLAVDSAGTIYVADPLNQRIREIWYGKLVSTPAGSIPGYADGADTLAKFGSTHGVAVDATGNLYVADGFNNRIRKITPAGVVSTLAGTGAPGNTDGGTGVATFKEPVDVAVDGAGNVYVADGLNNLVRKVTPAGMVSTLPSSGPVPPGTQAAINFPAALALDGAGNLYVADMSNNMIRKITPSGAVSVLAGSGVSGYLDGPAASAQFKAPSGVAVDPAGNVYVADLNNRIRKITPAGVVSTLAGSGVAGMLDGPPNVAQFNFLLSKITVDASGNVYVADSWNNRIRKVTPAGVVSTVAGKITTFGLFVVRNGDGPSNLADFNQPMAIAVDAAGTLYVGDFYNYRIRKIQ